MLTTVAQLEAERSARSRKFFDLRERGYSIPEAHSVVNEEELYAYESEGEYFEHPALPGGKWSFSGGALVYVRFDPIKLVRLPNGEVRYDGGVPIFDK